VLAASATVYLAVQIFDIAVAAYRRAMSGISTRSPGNFCSSPGGSRQPLLDEGVAGLLKRAYPLALAFCRRARGQGELDDPRRVGHVFPGFSQGAVAGEQEQFGAASPRHVFLRWCC